MPQGLAAVYSVREASPVPQVRMRPISSPASDVHSTVSPIRCCGVPWASASACTPRSRSTSMVRWLVMWARGVFATQPYLVTSVVCIPYVANSRAADPPAGPLRTTRTSVSWVIGRVSAGADRLRLHGMRAGLHGLGVHADRARRGPQPSPHHPGQVLLVAESAPYGDVRDRQRAGAQQPLRVPQPQ